MSNNSSVDRLTFANYLTILDRKGGKEELEEMRYNTYLNSKDEKLATFRKTGQTWVSITEQNKEFINHEASRGADQEGIIIDALKMSLGKESERVVSGQILVSDINSENREYSTQQDVIVLKRGAQLVYDRPTYKLVKPEDVLVVIEVKTKIHGMDSIHESSIRSILQKPIRVDLDKDHILFGIFGFEKSFGCHGLQKRGKSLKTIDDLIKANAPRNFLLAASDKYFIRQYIESRHSRNVSAHYYFEQGLAFGYFIANVMHHIDLQDGKDEEDSVRARFPQLAKTPAQVYP